MKPKESIFNGYELSRAWFDFCFLNPEKIVPNHGALFFFCIEHCHRLGWKPKFGLPTEMAKEAIGIRSYNTYSKTLESLIEWGFIILVEKSKNQYSSNIVALSIPDKAVNKALDKATVKHVIKHHTKQGESTIQSTGESICSIDKPLTINHKPLTINERKHSLEIVYDLKYFEGIGYDWKIEEPLRSAFDSFLAYRQKEYKPSAPITSGGVVEAILKNFYDRSINPKDAEAIIQFTISRGAKHIIFDGWKENIKTISTTSKTGISNNETYEKEKSVV